ncbi:RagB/SusD family nutrient uptake outer membrane protein [Chryseobacterium hagamense]|uniref:Membrane protein n=1 Tax=Chryseobacterium hagamense TaxID=395935 RepID=A0A511YIF5_9FLAO|nr:RagB/SusD family nutrient uptake outer membrane protein [Chryseobacterium hagamense]GEN74972.1 membrane protein [Chryseobacterium hagamense]
MKKIKYIITGLAAIVILNSCERDLDQYSPQKVALEDAFKDINGFQTGINAAYDAMKDNGYFSGDTSQLAIPDEVSDNLVISPLGRSTNFLAYNWNFAGNLGSVTNLFIVGYKAISYANLPLKYIDKLPDGAQKNDIAAQARGIRAIIHFDLVRAYCKIPTQSSDANSSRGIDYVTEFNPAGVSEGRKLSVSQVYDKIIDDLIFAANNISTSSTDKGRLTKPAILGMLSRVYLYKGDYQNSVNYGQQSIALSSSVGTLQKFPSIWSSNETDGVLFKILNSKTESVSTGAVYQQGAKPDGTGQIIAEYVVPKSFYNLFTDNDIRKSAYMRRYTYVKGASTLTANTVIKWAYNTSDTAMPLNVVEVKYLRTAEVYLNVAESAYRAGNESTANTLLNNLKAQRYTGYVPVNLSGQSLLNEILLQRRLELAFEMDRFYTLKRLGLGLQRSGEGPSFDGTGVPASTQIIPANSFKWQWPIPQSSINKDPGLPQNDGY